jgi:hypothetical protein
MSKTALTLAAAVIATATLSTTANAGFRVGMGGPLIGFMVREHQNQSYNSGSSYGAKKHCAKPAPRRHVAEQEAPVRRVKHAAPKRKQIEVAEAAPAPRIRKIKKVVEKPVEVKTAKLEDRTVISDAAPTIIVPDSPPAAELKGTQSTVSAITTAAIEPEKPAVATTEEPKTVDTKPVEPKVEAKIDTPKEKIELPSTVKRICRRFSAAIAGLIDVPCE